jgi:hypothetical protein
MQGLVDNSDISLKRLNNEKDLVAWAADDLSKEICGQPVERQFPVYIVFYKGKSVGFFQTIQQMVVYPALHPDRISPRQFLKITRSLVTEFKRMTGNPIFMLCKKDAEFGEKNMKRIRLKRCPENAYMYDEEAK